MNSAKKVCCVAFVAILFAPMIQRLIKLAPDVTLAGVVSAAESPELSIAGWFDGSYQEARERYFGEHFGFRPYFIKTYNQLHFSLFRRIPGRRGTQIVIGKDNWLYELEYVRRYTREGRTRRKRLLQFARSLRALQEAVTENGGQFVFLISPSKVEVYPEFLPEERIPDFSDGRPVTDYARFVPLLDEAGVKYIDGHRLFLDLREVLPYALFARGGTHWNHYAIFFVLKEIMNVLPQKSPTWTLPSVEIASVDLREPIGADSDLADLLNLWFDGDVSGPAPYPDLTVDAIPFDDRPDVLIVGDSFAFTVIDALRAGKMAGKIDFLYYFKRHFDYPIGDDEAEHGQVPQAPLDHDTMDWESLLISKDLVIFEVNEILISRLGWGFPKAACRAFENSVESSAAD